MMRLILRKDRSVNAHIRPAPGQADAEYLHICAECGLALPIRICPDDEDATNISCASCGARYRGYVDTENDELRLNIRIDPD